MIDISWYIYKRGLLSELHCVASDRVKEQGKKFSDEQRPTNAGFVENGQRNEDQKISLV